MAFTRIVITIYGLLFALLGVGFLAAPQLLAQKFNVEALGVSGLATLRADLGGLFLALSALCLVGVWRRKRSLLVAAAMILGAIAIGRITGMIASGTLTGLRVTLPMEIAATVALTLHARKLGVAPAGGQPPPLRRALMIGGGIALSIAAVVVLVALVPPLQQAAFAQGSRAVIRRDNSGLLAGDALRVAVCGSSSPLPSARRAKACVAVMAGGRYYLVDVGPESVEVVGGWGIPLSQIGGVLLTHFHSDHIGDLGELNLQTWAQGRPAPLPVYGGPGVDQVVDGFNQAYRLDQGYRTRHHGAGLMPAEAWPLLARPVMLVGEATSARARTAVVLDDGALRITAIELDHGPVAPAYAYRFDYKGRSVVITGDTKGHQPLARASRGVDLMLSEALNRGMVRTMEQAAAEGGRPRIAAIMRDIQDYHVSPTEAAVIANQAEARLLVLYHLIPAPDNALTRRLFVDGLDRARKGEWAIAEDGSLYTLPVSSRAIRIGRIPG